MGDRDEGGEQVGGGSVGGTTGKGKQVIELKLARRGGKKNRRGTKEGKKKIKGRNIISRRPPQ